jgi:hypothetical protein
MSNGQTQPRELGPRQKARRAIATLYEAGYAGLPETLVLSAIYDLHQRIEILERRLATQRGKRDAGD